MQNACPASLFNSFMKTWNLLEEPPHGVQIAANWKKKKIKPVVGVSVPVTMFTCLSNLRRFNSSQSGYCIYDHDSLLIKTHFVSTGLLPSLARKIPVRGNALDAEGASGRRGGATIWVHLSNESHHRGRQTALASYAWRCNLILIHFPPLIRVLFQKAVYFPGEQRRRDYPRPVKVPRFLIMSPDHS